MKRKKESLNPLSLLGNNPFGHRAEEEEEEEEAPVFVAIPPIPRVVYGSGVPPPPPPPPIQKYKTLASVSQYVGERQVSFFLLFFPLSALM